MRNLLYLREKGVIRGPFSASGIENMRKRGVFSDDAEISPDKVAWRPLTAPSVPARCVAAPQSSATIPPGHPAVPPSPGEAETMPGAPAAEK